MQETHVHTEGSSLTHKQLKLYHISKSFLCGSPEMKKSLVFIGGGAVKLNPWLQQFRTAETGAGGHSDTDHHRLDRAF